jgi:glycosyltransferase involved in cell wall biosynthesis
VLDFISCNKIGDAVKVLGLVPIDDLKALYGLACGVVVPSLYEQSSGPIMEAMVLGCPVAGSCIADLPELMGEDCGLLFDPTDVDDIARSIMILWEEEARCKAMADRAGKRIRSIRSWKAWSEGYNQIYQVCAEESMARRKKME